MSYNASKDSMAPLDETESINLQVTDSLLDSALIIAYNIGQTHANSQGETVPYNPKKFPTKAIDIVFRAENIPVELYFNTNEKKWGSKLFYNGTAGHLSPEQMGQFFTSEFYTKLMNVLEAKWPLSDTFYNELYTGVAKKEMMTDYPKANISEDDGVAPDEERKYTRSGRRIVDFGDFGVNAKSCLYQCWPHKGKEFRWSQWKDPSHIKPLVKMKFKYSNGHEYVITVSPYLENFDKRGFRSLDLTEQPAVQWLTKQENIDLMKLSQFNRFIKYCEERIQSYLDMDTDEIYKRINSPERITKDEIDYTKRVIRKNLNEIIKRKQPESFIWS